MILDDVVRSASSAIVLALLLPIAHAAEPPQAVGEGCSTAYFIDKDCDGYGVGVKSSGVYQLGDVAGMVDTAGDKPDADDMDPTVNTTASWQAKWGADNAGMVRFLRQRKGFYNTDRIFYVAPDGNDTTGAMNDPAHPFATTAAAQTAMADLQGGAIIVRGGDWGKSLRFDLNYGSSVVSGSVGHPVYVMNYPGELVITSATVGGGSSSAPGRVYGNITYDGIVFRSTGIGLGDAVSATDSENLTLLNDEFVGWHQIFFGDHTEDALIQENVFHEMNLHAIYFGWSSSAPPPNQNLGDIDFDKAQQDYLALNPDGTSPSYRSKILNNVIYNSGAGGYDPIHTNTYGLGLTIDGNLVSYSGGAPITLQTGIVGSTVSNNVFFDNGNWPIKLNVYNYSPGAETVGGTIINNVIENNTIHGGDIGDAIRGTNPAGGVWAGVGTQFGTHWIKNNAFRNNIIAVNGGAYSPSLFFGGQSYPDTQTIERNLFAYTNPSVQDSNNIALSVQPNAAGTLAAGNYNFARLNGLTPNIRENLHADPKFISASLGFTLTPEKFNLAPQPGSPAIDAGTITGAPKRDVRGVLRDAHPDIGAYEYHPDHGPTPLASLMASARTIVAGSPVILTWTSLNADSCVGTGFDTDGRASGLVTISPSATGNFGLVCTGRGGAGAAQDLFVKVLKATEVPTLSLTGPARTKGPGQPAPLRWAANSPVPYFCEIAGVGALTAHAPTVFVGPGPQSGTAQTFPAASRTFVGLCPNIYGAAAVVSWHVEVAGYAPAAASGVPPARTPPADARRNADTPTPTR